jgi:type VI secretion system protein ImpK
MKVLTSSPSGAELIERAPSAALSPAFGIRDLLRDTALLVSRLRIDNAVTTYATLRTECDAMIDQFGSALVGRGYSGDILQDARIAHCALLDETALQSLFGTDRDNWASQPLQVTKFHQHDAGERVFERLDQRMRERTPNLDLLQFYAAILGLGFKGRYAVNGEASRLKLIVDLDAQLARARPAATRTLLSEQTGRRFGDRLRRLSPWALAAVGGVVSLVLWLLWHIALDAQLAALPSQVTRP